MLTTVFFWEEEGGRGEERGVAGRGTVVAAAVMSWLMCQLVRQCRGGRGKKTSR
jgi:hypothetical protein